MSEPTSQVDWEAIKLAYERGFEPTTVISKRHGVSTVTIAKYAYVHKWRRLALEGAGASAVEATVGTMAADLARVLRQQMTHLTRNLNKEMKRKDGEPAARLALVNTAIRGLSSATDIIEKVLKINAGHTARIDSLRSRHGGDDPRAELERRIAGFMAEGRSGEAAERPS